MFMGRGVNIDEECVEWLSMTLVCDGYCQVHNSSGFWGISKFHHSIHLSYLSSWLFHLLIHPWILFPSTFHVSVLLPIFAPLFYFCSLNPNPDICPILITLTCSSSILICSEPHVCSSVWNWHWLSLELLIWTSECSTAPCPKLEDSRPLVAQHISWSQVLTKNIDSQYTLSPCPSL